MVKHSWYDLKMILDLIFWYKKVVYITNQQNQKTVIAKSFQALHLILYSLIKT